MSLVNYQHYLSQLFFNNIKYYLIFLQASQAAAQARYGGRSGQGSSSATDSRTTAENLRLGMTLEEAQQILNVSQSSSGEEISKNYDHLFTINDKAKGGSFYLQSKFYRAKERIDKELVDNPPPPEPKSEPNPSPSGDR